LLVHSQKGALMGIKMVRILVSLFVLSLTVSEHAAFAQTPPCPALRNGQRIPLRLPQVSESELQIDPSVSVPDAIAKTAAGIVGTFEGGGGDPWITVSGQERVSLGFMQWNWATGTLIKTFIKGLAEGDIDLAPARLRSDLAVLRSYATDPTKKGAATEIIDRWTIAAAGDPLDRISGIRKSVTEDLKIWLATEPVKTLQMKLLDADMRRAYALARAWKRDSSNSATVPPVDARLLASFFDLVTFNGGTAGIWLPQIRLFRHEHADAPSVVKAVSDWLHACNDSVIPGFQHTRLYNRDEAAKNADYWSDLVRQDVSAFDEEQIDLLVFGFLRATRSAGSNPPKGFPGIYQADVMSRRGVIALGSGYIRGGARPVKLF
jgi:hypothetical protein